MLIEEYIEWRRSLHRANSTVQDDARCLFHFRTWCIGMHITHPGHVTLDHLLQYSTCIQRMKKKDGQPLSESRQCSRMYRIVTWYGWLHKAGTIVHDPTRSLTLKRPKKSLPKPVLTHDEVEHIMMQPDLNTVCGIRDRAMLETLYSTGIRRAELLNIALDDLNRSTGVLFVRLGKGKKDRVVPAGERCIVWIERYLYEARPSLVCYPEDPALFLTIEGTPLSSAYLSELVRNYITKAGITKQGACHLFRHSMATGMLENGADTRYIQQILGHEQLSTTQIYTRVSIKSLQQVYTKTHPAEQ